MKVMKFGGTSVGSIHSILSVKQIVESQHEPVIVVVSALGGITDKLIRTSQMAASGDMAYEKEFQEIVRRHMEMVDAVIPEGTPKEELNLVVSVLLNELKDIYQGLYLIKDLSPKTSAAIVSYGERISSRIVATLIDGARWYDSRQFIKTEKKHARHILDSELTNRLVKEAFADLPQVALVPGFISTDKDSGEVTNLGRGGSDYTAAIIAAALDADSLEIWTDVDGFMTADPRVISTAYTINRLSYGEAMEPERPPQQGYQGHLVHQRHQPHHRAGPRHGGSHRREPPHLPHVGGKWHQRLPRLTGFVGKQYLHRCEKPGCHPRLQGAQRRVRQGD